MFNYGGLRRPFRRWLTACVHQLQMLTSLPFTNVTEGRPGRGRAEIIGCNLAQSAVS
jgi:hypothetical protein